MSSSRRGMFRSVARAAAKAGIEAAETNQAFEAAMRPATVPPPSLFTPEELERYETQFAVAGWSEPEQVALRDSSVLIVGAGALGCPVAHALVGAGVGRVGIVDGGDVTLSDLHRQPLHYSTDLEQPKAHSAVAKLQVLNPEVMVEPYQMWVQEDTVDGLIVGHDLIVDSGEDASTRALLNRACCAQRVALVTGAVGDLAGFCFVTRPGESACYRCAFPAPAEVESIPGVLAPAAGVIAGLMALEALRLLADFSPPTLNARTDIALDAERPVTRTAVARRDDCPDCGEPDLG